MRRVLLNQQTNVGWLMNGLERYFNDCLDLVNELTPRLPPEDIALADHFIQHGEPAEGIRVLAFSITENGVRISSRTLDLMKGYMDGFIDPAHLPPDLDACVVADE